MRAERLRTVAGWTTLSLLLFIVAFTLLLSPAEGGALSRWIPGTVPVVGDRTAYDACVGGVRCEYGHALAFLALAMSMTVQAVATRHGSPWLVGAALLGGLLLFAALNEAAQSWVGRDASLADWLADAAGIVIGMALGSQFARLLLSDSLSDAAHDTSERGRWRRR